MEVTGYSCWCEKLLAELGIEHESVMWQKSKPSESGNRPTECPTAVEATTGK
jgi:hypothetical protein